MHQASVEFFEDWRSAARRLALADVPPAQVRWIDGRSVRRSGQADLFETQDGDSLPEPKPSRTLHVPNSFLSVARTTSFHRAAKRWELLYELLWRLTHGEQHLMNVASDPAVFEIQRMEKAVRRDAHKMKAFVRFRQVDEGGVTRYVAWHRPEHYSLRFTSDFFARRFDTMRWTIMTPDESVTWDGQRLTFGPGLPRSEAPTADELESLWKTYYAKIFNPARIKLKAMRAEMPKKHWSTMPETQMIDQMLHDAPRRVETMVRQTASVASAQPFVPPERDLATLRQAAASCRGCDLCQNATQTVFGSGPEDAQVVIVGEQPGDQEDELGKPFVGPAGQVLSQVLAQLGIDRDSVYLTNAVKHFKFTRSGKRRLHKTPSSREIAACRPWLEAELETIRPQHLVCLGANAARVIFGPNFRLTQQRGIVTRTDFAPWTLATFHPSALLRAKPEAAEQMRQQFEEDLGQLAATLK